MLLHQGAQQVDACLDVFVGLLLEELLDGREELLAVQAFSAEAAEYISDVPGQFAVVLLVKQPE